MRPLWLLRDTRSLIRGIGADDQAGVNILLAPVMVPTVQVGDPLQLLPAPLLRTHFGRAIQGVGGSAFPFVEIWAGGAELHLWAMQTTVSCVAYLTSSPTGGSGIVDRPMSSALTGVSFPSPPTGRVRRGTTTTAPPLACDSTTLETLSTAGSVRRIPRGAALVLYGSLAAADLQADWIVSDVGPALEQPG